MNSTPSTKHPLEYTEQDIIDELRPRSETATVPGNLAYDNDTLWYVTDDYVWYEYPGRRATR